MSTEMEQLKETEKLYSENKNDIEETEEINNDRTENKEQGMEKEVTKYVYHRRIFLLLVTLLLAFTDLAVIILIFWILVLSFIVYKTIKSENKTQKSFVHFSNEILGFPDVATTLYEFDIRHNGLQCLFVALYSSINTTIIFFLYSSETYDISWQRMIVSHSNQLERMLHVELMVSLYVVFILFIGVVFSGHQTVHKEYCEKLEVEKSKLLSCHKDTKIQSIDDRIQNKLKKWKQTKEVKNRKLELVLNLCFSVLIRIFFSSYWTPNGWISVKMSLADSIEWQHYMFAAYISIVDTIIISVLIYHAHTMLSHLQFLNVITKELSSSIEADTIGDIMAWWELRKFYLECIIDTYAIGFTGLLVVILLLSFALIINAVLFVTWDEYNIHDEWVFSLSVPSVYLIYLSIKNTMISVSFHNEQLTHSNTINREQMRFKMNDINNFKMFQDKNTVKHKIAIYKEQLSALKEFFDFIHKDILENTKPLILWGVKMNHNFMLFMRATLITAVITIVIRLTT